jgi:hypothetical protein
MAQTRGKRVISEQRLALLIENRPFFDLHQVATELLGDARAPSIDDKYRIRKLLAAAREPDLTPRWTPLREDDCILRDVELWVRTTSSSDVRCVLELHNAKLRPVREKMLTLDRSDRKTCKLFDSLRRPCTCRINASVIYFS